MLSLMSAFAVFSLQATLKFGLIFLDLQVAGMLAQRALGRYGFYAVSLAGGLIRFPEISCAP